MLATSNSNSTHHWRSVAILATVLLIAATACGDDQPSASEQAQAAEPAQASEQATTAPDNDRAGYGAYEPAPTTAPATATPVSAAPVSATPATEAPAGEAPVATGAAVVQLVDGPLGQVVSDGEGFTLYMFTPDAAGTPTCEGQCAASWPPVLIDESVELSAGAGIDAALLSTVAHPDGGMQLKYGEWPLYRFAGDAAPGETNGQGAGSAWYVVGADAEPVN